MLETARKDLGLEIRQFYGKGYHFARDAKANRISVDRVNGIIGKWGELGILAPIKKISEADVFFDEIVSLEEQDYNGHIYDLTVDGNHTFTTWDGLIVHNTSLANRISMDWLGEPVGKVSEIPHETREVQKKEHVIVKSKGKELEMNLLDMPGIATKVDYREFSAYGLKKEEAQTRAKEATKGIIEAIKWLENVDAALVVMDSSEDPFTQVNITILGNLEARKIPVIIVANKMDSKKAKPEKVREAFPQHHVVSVSALTGENMNLLYEMIAKHAR
ncbi:50S ribosome-binding GTPase [Candidatus Micrarchaeota archaeon]|nr:50S ribosome-binding GTPase [Candidatus Micrarchaeota archaeon]